MAIIPDSIMPLYFEIKINIDLHLSIALIRQRICYYYSQMGNVEAHEKRQVRVDGKTHEVGRLEKVQE